MWILLLKFRAADILPLSPEQQRSLAVIPPSQTWTENLYTVSALFPHVTNQLTRPLDTET